MITSRAFIPLFARLFIFSFFLLAALLFCLAPPQAKSAQGQASVPAFSGAEGGGAVSIGGRGGEVVFVTTTADATNTIPFGSLRWALTVKTQPRTVVFRVAGVITLVDSIKIKHPYVTVAGQTAPAPGIMLRLPPYVAGSSANISETLISIQTHDVVIRYLRLRHGYAWNTEGGDSINAGDNLAVGDNAYNVIIDHVSASWAQDENMSIFAKTSPTDTTKFITYPHNVTLSRNIIAEGFKDHPTALIMGSDSTTTTTSISLSNNMVDLDLHHNLFINNSHRNPLLNIKRARVVNNIFYNWASWASGVTGGIQADFINNYYRRGPMLKSTSLKVLAWRPTTETNGKSGYATGVPAIYMSGNISGITPLTATLLTSATMSASYNMAFNKDPEGSFTGTVSASQLPIQVFPITLHSAITQLEKSLIISPDLIFSDVGASHRLDKFGHWISAYDDVDKRLFGNYAQLTGTSPVSTSNFLTITFPYTNTYYGDQDNDGMPDVWEKRYSFPHTLTNGISDTIGIDFDFDGYTNLEEFLNGTIPVTNLLQNGEFSDVSSNWLYSGVLTKELTSGQLSMTLPSAIYPSGTISQSNFPLKKNITYQLSFSIRASKPYTVAAYIAQHADLITTYMPVFTFTLKTGSTEMITQAFKMTVTDNTSVFALRFGNAASGPTTPFQVWLDNVAIFTIPATSTVASSVAAAAASDWIDESAESEEGAIAVGDGDTDVVEEAKVEEANVVVNEDATEEEAAKEEETEDVNNRSLFLPFVSRTEE